MPLVAEVFIETTSGPSPMTGNLLV